VNRFVADGAPSVTRVVKVFRLGTWLVVGVQVTMSWGQMLALVTAPEEFVTDSV
jgi:hypothetical protein